MTAAQLRTSAANLRHNAKLTENTERAALWTKEALELEAQAEAMESKPVKKP